jgi:hypothetical protein
MAESRKESLENQYGDGGHRVSHKLALSLCSQPDWVYIPLFGPKFP